MTVHSKYANKGRGFRKCNSFWPPCGVALPMEWMCVATFLLNAESINACRCGVANKSRMIWRWLVLIGWATVWRQQQGSDQASRYWSASLLAGRRWRVVRGRALVNNSASGVCILSHAHTVVWECCKDDQQSQWEMLKFDPPLPLNPWSDRHQIWRASLCHGCLSPRKNWAQSVKEFLLPIYAKYTPPMFACLLLFLVLPIAYSRDPCMDFHA